MKRTGIYKIVNTITGKIYIGSTSKSFSYRFGIHKLDLRRGKHHSSHLQKSWNKYGESTFEFIIIEECNKENCIIREQYYLDLYKSYLRHIGYNMSPNAQSRLGIKKTEDQIVRKYRNIYCFTLTGNLIKVYPTMVEITKDGYTSNNVCAVLSKFRKSYNNKLWSLLSIPPIYKRNNKGRPMPHSIQTKDKMSKSRDGVKRPNISVPIIQLLYGIPVKLWSSVTEAENVTGILKTNISANLKNKRPSAGGYQFKYF